MSCYNLIPPTHVSTTQHPTTAPKGVKAMPLSPNLTPSLKVHNLSALHSTPGLCLKSGSRPLSTHQCLIKQPPPPPHSAHHNRRTCQHHIALKDCTQRGLTYALFEPTAPPKQSQDTITYQHYIAPQNCAQGVEHCRKTTPLPKPIIMIQSAAPCLNQPPPPSHHVPVPVPVHTYLSALHSAQRGQAVAAKPPHSHNPS